MAMEKLEKRIKRLYKHIKSGRVTEEIADEIADTLDNVEELGEEAKEKFSEAINDMKKALNKTRG